MATKSSTTTTVTSPLSPNSPEEAHQAQHHHHGGQHNHKAPQWPAHHQNARLAVRKRYECTSNDINECAAAYIQWFRQQLKIQQVDSVEIERIDSIDNQRLDS